MAEALGKAIDGWKPMGFIHEDDIPEAFGRAKPPEGEDPWRIIKAPPPKPGAPKIMQFPWANLRVNQSDLRPHIDTVNQMVKNMAKASQDYSLPRRYIIPPITTTAQEATVSTTFESFGNRRIEIDRSTISDTKDGVYIHNHTPYATAGAWLSKAQVPLMAYELFKHSGYPDAFTDDDGDYRVDTEDGGGFEFAEPPTDDLEAESLLAEAIANLAAYHAWVEGKGEREAAAKKAEEEAAAKAQAAAEAEQKRNPNNLKVGDRVTTRLGSKGVVASLDVPAGKMGDYMLLRDGDSKPLSADSGNVTHIETEIPKINVESTPVVNIHLNGDWSAATITHAIDTAMKRYPSIQFYNHS